MQEAHPTAVAACCVLEQCEAFVGTLTQAQLSAPSISLQNSTIGQHLRHLLDHFAAPLAALEGGTIDYDHRERGVPVETDLDAALGRIREVRERINVVGFEAGGGAAIVRVMLSANGDEAELESTLARELAFAAHHAVHHQAMMAAIAHEQGLTPPTGFGRAPSTLRHDRGTRS